MENYGKMENEMQNFKKYLSMTMDLLCDSYKWHKLSEYADDQNTKEKYKQIGDMLYDAFIQEHNNIKFLFKGE